MFTTSFKILKINELCDEHNFKNILLEMLEFDNLVNP